MEENLHFHKVLHLLVEQFITEFEKYIELNEVHKDKVYAEILKRSYAISQEIAAVASTFLTSYETAAVPISGEEITKKMSYLVETSLQQDLIECAIIAEDISKNVHLSNDDLHNILYTCAVNGKFSLVPSSMQLLTACSSEYDKITSNCFPTYFSTICATDRPKETSLPLSTQLESTCSTFENEVLQLKNSLRMGLSCVDLKFNDRDSWMQDETFVPTLIRDQMTNGLTSRVRKKRAEARRKDEEKEVMKSRELNPHWKKGGTGLPEDKKEVKTPRLPFHSVDDDRYGYLQKTHKRIWERDERKRMSMEEVAGERLGCQDSMGDNEMGDISKRATRKIGYNVQERKDVKKSMHQRQKLCSALENCEYCLDSPNMKQHLIVTIFDQVYVCVPNFQTLTEGHCLIVPKRHVPSFLALDEDEWNGFQDALGAVRRLFRQRGKSVLFMETSLHFGRCPHAVAECIPVPEEQGDLAPLYFKKAILETEEEWAHNIKLLDLTKKGLRCSIPKNLSYFAILFDPAIHGGYAHIIEDEESFPRNFGKVYMNYFQPGSYGRKVRGNKIELLTSRNALKNIFQEIPEESPDDGASSHLEISDFYKAVTHMMTTSKGQEKSTNLELEVLSQSQSTSEALVLKTKVKAIVNSVTTVRNNITPNKYCCKILENYKKNHSNFYREFLKENHVLCTPLFKQPDLNTSPLLKEFLSPVKTSTNTGPASHSPISHQESTWYRDISTNIMGCINQSENLAFINVTLIFLLIVCIIYFDNDNDLSDSTNFVPDWILN